MTRDRTPHALAPPPDLVAKFPYPALLLNLARRGHSGHGQVLNPPPKPTTLLAVATQSKPTHSRAPTIQAPEAYLCEHRVKIGIDGGCEKAHQALQAVGQLHGFDFRLGQVADVQLLVLPGDGR